MLLSFCILSEYVIKPANRNRKPTAKPETAWHIGKGSRRLPHFRTKKQDWKSFQSCFFCCIQLYSVAFPPSILRIKSAHISSCVKQGITVFSISAQKCRRFATGENKVPSVIFQEAFNKKNCGQFLNVFWIVYSDLDKLLFFLREFVACVRSVYFSDNVNDLLIIIL